MKWPIICIAALALAGCAKNIDTEDAVKQGVLKDIAGKVDVSSMDVNVDSVSFRDKEADATISFSPKGGSRSQAITMNYQMERQGDVWKVKGRNMKGHEAQGSPAGTPGQADAMPPGHPGMGAAEGQMPAGHPAMGGAQGQMPPGHPTMTPPAGGSSPKQ